MKMLSFSEKMWCKYVTTLVCLVVCIYCEEILNDDEMHSHEMKLESRKFSSYYRHNLQNERETSLSHHQVFSDEPSNAQSVPFDAGDRNYARRTFRRRKMGSNNHKKNIFRRGQRHRHNKNGNSFRKTTNQFFSLITQSRQ